MKTLHIKHIIGGLLFVSSLALFSACSGTDDFTDTTASVSGLKVSLAIGDASVVQAASRAGATTLSETSLNEDKIDNLNLLFYKSDGTLAKSYYLTSGLKSGITSLLSSGSEWTSSLVPGTTYNVYAIANWGADLSGKLEADLKALMKTDAAIYKIYSAENNKYKLFVMDGKVDDTSTWTSPTGSADATIPVTLQRAADKIVMDISLDGTNLKATDAAWTWNIVNYATNTSVLAGQTYDKTVASTTDGFSVTPANNEAKITTYCYDHSWNNAISGQTMIEVNIPCTYKGTPYSINKYRLPITTLKSTGRNNIYKITAKLDKLGNTNTDVNYTLNYKVEPWITHDIDVDNANVNFLIVSPQEVTMKNISDYNDIKYYSSSQLKSVTVDKAWYYDALQNTVYITPSDYNVTVTNPNTTATSGTVKFHSNVPTNLGPRYIRLIFTNNDGLSRTVLIKQYPLEYITAISGAFSYKDDGSNDLGTAAHSIYTYNPISDVYESGTSNYYDDYMFRSKYFDGSEIIRCGYWSSDGKDNNQMYVVRITSTSSTYKVDKPLVVNGVTDPSAANNDVVSPAFMIASQLGTVSSESWANASDHCKRYVEVSSTGTRYADWRLPTLAELEIIAKYQKNGHDVMYEVLGGSYYWSAYHVGSVSGYFATGNAGNKILGRYPGTNGLKSKDNCYIRCIRDLKPDELANDK